MAEESDMERPVTRRELKDELGKVETKLDRKIEAWGGALLARVDSVRTEIDSVRTEMVAVRTEMAAMRTDLIREMARQTKAAMEWALDQFRVVDDKYTDLPGRVSRLERKVFPPKRARRR